MNEKYSAIKLYAKTVETYRCSSNQEAIDRANTFVKETIFLSAQECKISIVQTKRKNNPFDLTLSFYELDTLKEMIDDAIQKQNKGDF